MSAVVCGFKEIPGAEIDGGEIRRKIARRLTRGIVREASIDHTDLHTLAPIPARLPRARSTASETFARHGRPHEVVELAHVPHVVARRYSFERAGWDIRLDRSGDRLRPVGRGD